MADANLTVKFDADTADAEAGIANLGAKTEEAGAKAEDSAIAWMAFGQGLMAIGEKANTAATGMVESFATFDQAIANMGATTNLTSQELDGLRQAAIDLSKETPKSATEIAAAYNVMAKAGMDAGAIQNEGIWIAKAATAANADMGETAKTVTDIMGVYGYKASDISMITDVLTTATNNSETTMAEMGSILGTVQVAASALNVGLNESAAMIATVTSNGVDASTAGAGLKAMFLQLASPSEKATKLMDEYGIVCKDQTGQFNMQMALDSMSGALGQAGDKTSQMALLTELFGAKAGTTAYALITNTDEVNKLTVATEQSGSTEESFGDAMDGTSNKIQEQKNRLEAARMEMADKMVPAQMVMTDATIALYDAFNDLPGPIRDTVAAGWMLFGQITQILGPIAQMYPLMKAINLEKMKDSLYTGYQTASNYAYAAAQWVANASLYGCPLVWILAAIIAVIAVIYLLITHWEEVSKAVGDFGANAQQALGDAGAAIQQWGADTGAAIQESWSGMEDWAGNVNAQADDLRDNLTQSATDTLSGMASNFTDNATMLYGAFTDITDQLDRQMQEVIDNALEWGRNIARSIENGIRDGIDNIGDAAGDAANSIKNYLGISSPAKMGPLSELPKWPERLVDTYSKGMLNKLSSLERAGATLAGATGAGSNYDQRQYNISPQMNIIAQPIDLNDPFIRSQLADMMNKELARQLSIS